MYDDGYQHPDEFEAWVRQVCRGLTHSAVELRRAARQISAAGNGAVAAMDLARPDASPRIRNCLDTLSYHLNDMDAAAGELHRVFLRGTAADNEGTS